MFLGYTWLMPKRNLTFSCLQAHFFPYIVLRPFLWSFSSFSGDILAVMRIVWCSLGLACSLIVITSSFPSRHTAVLVLLVIISRTSVRNLTFEGISFYENILWVG